MTDLFEKYDVPVPRYTSYPTVPYWSETPSVEQWIGHLTRSLETPDSTWSMYLHIPFCQSLCTFCGCNNIITRDHGKEEPYLKSIHAEWQSYLKAVPALATKDLRHLHIGGGSPTFYSPENFKRLLAPIFAHVRKDPDHFEGSIEIDPRTTDPAKLAAYREMGFSRISLGVQDFDPEVQRLVNRNQPFQMTADTTREARKQGFTGVNFDLIYGLAGQTPESFRRTAELTVELRPDRIALYSFALVPWIKPAQRLFKDEDLPKRSEKWELYRIARKILLSGGYVEVGMDHFALSTDPLAAAMREGRLHRNFMGYTDQRTDVMLGLGVSAISETPLSFHQNEKVLTQYQAKADSGAIPTHRGHVLTEDDRLHRKQILKLMTTFHIELQTETEAAEAKVFLAEMISDGLVEIRGRELFLTEKGRPFLRNACLFFDRRLREKQPKTQLFSKSI